MAAGNLPVPQGVEIRWFYEDADGAGQAICVLHAKNTASAPIDQAAANSVAGVIRGAFTTSLYATHVVPDIRLGRVDVRDQSDLTRPAFAGTGAAVPGTSVVPTPLPAATAFVVSGFTGLRGASYRSRTYLWGFSTSAVDPAGGMSSAAAGHCLDFMEAIRTGLLGATPSLQVSVLSRFHKGPTDPVTVERNPPILTQITSYGLKDLRFDVQRRRAVPGI